MLTKTMSPLALCMWRLLRPARRTSSGSSPKPMRPKINPAIATHSSSLDGDFSDFSFFAEGTARPFLPTCQPCCAEKRLTNRKPNSVNDGDWASFSAPRQALSKPPQSPPLSTGGRGPMDFISILSIFVLACFVGYFVVWSVTPALHTPLMSVTNAISSVIVVGALIAAAAAGSPTAKWLGLVAVALASVNIFGGFAVTARMLAMYKKKERRDA